MNKIEAARQEYADWCQAIGIDTIEKLNETLLEDRRRCPIVMMSGPSSSGKTSSSLRIAQQARVLGLNPKVIELDNYFVNREDTPLDENGERDYEALGAMDIKFLNEQLDELLAGKEVKLPKFDFVAGERKFTGETMRLERNDILFMEGIHALNPDLTPGVPQNKIFRIYISALSSLPGGRKEHNSTTDKRLLRRIVRDNRTRGISPEENILRWPSVRRGEEKYIFPFDQNANVVFNSSTLYDMPLLKYYAEPLLCGISVSSPAYEKAQELLDFMKDILPLRPVEIAAIPPTSIMREFIGGQTL